MSISKKEIMKRKTNNQRGFAIFEVLFFVLLGLVLIGIAYYVGKHSNKTDNTQATKQTVTPQSKTSTTPVKTDKDQIADLVATVCGNSQAEAQKVVDEANNLAIDGSWASLTVNCPGGETSYVAFLKKTSSWDFFDKTQQGASCSKFDGSGVSAKIVPECYDDSTGQNRIPQQ
jgi:hypothetical protein